MTRSRYGKHAGWIPCGLVLGVSALVGCGLVERAEPVFVANPRFGAMTVAVAPAINLSGSADFDRNRFADLFASELSFAKGISVIPVSRVLGVLAADGLEGVDSPDRAFQVAGLLGADAILVFAVTEYDPYDPPRIGIAAQLYAAPARSRDGTVDPNALSRQARLVKATGKVGKPGLIAQTQKVFDASHNALVADLKAFAQHRTANNSPYSWRRYVVSQQEFIRYCCHRTIRALLSGRDASVATDANPER